MIYYCRECGSKIEIDVTREQVEKWKAGALIQDVMPELSKNLRELMISGICGSCFDRMFGESV